MFKKLLQQSRSFALLRLVISAILLAVVYATVDFPSLLATLKQVSAPGIMLIMLLYLLGQGVSAIKWNVFLKTSGIERSFPQVLKAYFFGMFVNTFGLGTVGGDVARSLAVHPAEGQRTASLATVVADRVHGLTTLLIIGAIATLIVQPKVFGQWGLVAALGAVVSLLVFWWLGPRILLRIFPETHRFSNAAKKASSAFPSEPRPLIIASLISAGFHSVQIYMHFIIAKELGADISLAYLFATVPLVNAASAMPISTNGLGIREAMYVLLFLPAGVPRETAVAFGAVWIVAVTIVSAIGGILVSSQLKTLDDKIDQSDLSDLPESNTKQAVVNIG